MEWQIGEKARIHIVFFAYKRLHLKQKKKKSTRTISLLSIESKNMKKVFLANGNTRKWE